MRTTRRAAERNYGLYGGMWGRVGPSRSQEEAEILREEPAGSFAKSHTPFAVPTKAWREEE